MVRMRAWLLLGVLALAGCGDGPAPGDTGGSALPAGESFDELRAQARAVLARSGPPPSWDPYAPNAGLAVESAAVDRAGTTLTVTFTGARDPATRSCGADYAAEAVEAPHAVAVIVLAQPHDAGEICPMIGFTRTATAVLTAPLGDRRVLQIHGEPVPVG